MKKIISFIICLMLIVSSFIALPKRAYADEKSFSSKSSLLMDYESGEILYAKNENARRPIASMTKIMTLAIIFDELQEGKLNLDDNIIVSERAMKMGGSQVFLQSGTEYRAEELIKTIIIASANDSSVAMAEHIGGSVEGFVDLMNEKANALQLLNTNFVNPTGLPQEKGYSSSLDVAKMTRELLSNKQYFKYSTIWMDKISHEGDRVTEISNTNKLLRRNIGVDSGKTGFTNEAMHCISASAKKGNMRLISVVIGAESSADRFNECEHLLNYGFQNYESVPLVQKDKVLAEGGKIKRAMEQTIFGVASDSYFALTKKRTPAKEIVEINYFDNLKAPIEKGEVIGNIRIYENSTLKKEIDILAKDNIQKRGLFDKVKLN